MTENDRAALTALWPMLLRYGAVWVGGLLVKYGLVDASGAESVATSLLGAIFTIGGIAWAWAVKLRTKDVVDGTPSRGIVPNIAGLLDERRTLTDRVRELEAQLAAAHPLSAATQAAQRARDEGAGLGPAGGAVG